MTQQVLGKLADSVVNYNAHASGDNPDAEHTFIGFHDPDGDLRDALIEVWCNKYVFVPACVRCQP
jgi:hypothetical protein